MANNFALNDAAMASPRPRPAATARALPLLQIAGEGVPVSHSPFAVRLQIHGRERLHGQES